MYGLQRPNSMYAEEPEKMSRAFLFRVSSFNWRGFLRMSDTRAFKMPDFKRQYKFDLLTIIINNYFFKKKKQARSLLPAGLFRTVV